MQRPLQVSRDQLDYLRFPLGGLPKSETRALAAELGLRVAEKPDSQDICFVPAGKYQAVVEKLRPGSIEPGDIVHIATPRRDTSTIGASPVRSRWNNAAAIPPASVMPPGRSPMPAVPRIGSPAMIR